ncbi:MAG: glycerol-3-phosphate 1-O-acyltransferase PlsY [Proteobacteria bacterium]|nr:glycerol-3-phosphate 1-O-acyltransferase PlsY [Pseudomonadota bacterium]
MLMDISLILLAYLLGSVSSAVVVCKLLQLEDPRTQGSKNPGATNVLRLYGKKAAIPTLVGDVLKGVVPVVIGHSLNSSDMILACIGLAAFSGHLFPVFFHFKGGKGVATFVGVLLGTYWVLGLAFMGTWLLMAAIFRYSSLSGLTAAAMTPAYTALLLESSLNTSFNSEWLIISTLLMAILLFWRHTSNIKNLLSGKEDKIGAK